MSTTYIYELVDPRNNQVRYVGKTMKDFDGANDYYYSKS